jgi:Putative auto-transporter adhesin, head GIN domain
MGQDRDVTIIMEGESKEPIVGSGTLATKTWDLTGFDRVQVRSTFRAAITKGTTFKVTTTADDNVLPLLQVVKDGTTLKIGLSRGSYRLKSQLKADVTLPTLLGLDITGASKGTLKGFQSERELKLGISGSSELAGSLAVETCDFKVDGSSTLNGSIQAKDLDLDIDGASHVTLTGEVKDAKIDVDSASSVTLTGLILQNADVKVSGASHASVDARGKLKYELSSASSLKYLGDPATLEGTKSGASSIVRSRSK